MLDVGYRSRLASSDPVATIHRPFGGGVIGNTAGSGPVVEGSSPSPRAKVVSLLPSAPSSSGLGRWPLKPVTPVQIRSGLLRRSHESSVIGSRLLLHAAT